ncbi:hypothetical protein BCR33DRAFT_393518 [Rhizoclosmatium globosum]|uniref:Glycosyltransferase 61 catalytic domain-containing protein n=1 Tax=Rhizoclosmatium globosum TaxID=329046 RepID=A0A1Y2B3E0_9FUNG|nr:hypothetical protein BCR33DRAFT_578267 [Rhizoclosmatium globosum]ORY39651.1 hypothetical protein BCR33DRAFT_393518 [Rhizoclosmatium globosum]|eukprot:ORY29244.1 hypothetical protein BCR33DRAFT_578267 [Rhizoclosmatium globosum]
MVYSLLNLTTDNSIQPVLLDPRNPDGPYTAAWSHYFTSSRRLIDIRQLMETAMTKWKQEHNNQPWKETRSPNICFKKAVFGIHGGISPMARGGSQRSECAHSPLFKAFREFLLSRARFWASNNPDNEEYEKKVPTWLPLPVKSAKYGTLFEQRIRHKYWKAMKEPFEQRKEQLLTLKSEATNTIVVTYAIRKSETPHGPSPIGSIFGLQLQGPEGTNTNPPIQATNGAEPALFRKVNNEVELIQRIQNTVNRWASPLLLSSRNVEFRAIDFATLSFDDQIAIAQGTDVFIGPHGAVFAYLMYLRKMPVAGVVELKPPERGYANQQFHNMAKRMGHVYDDSPIGSAVSEKQMDMMEQSLRRVLDLVFNARQ